MTIAVEADVKAVIQPAREEKVVLAILQAWNDWLTCPVKSQYSRWPRTRANMVFERLADHLQKTFADDEGVNFYFQDETIKIVFDNKLLVRCKKADGSGFGSNVETQASLAFESQADLPGFEGHQKIEILYTINRTGTAITSIIVQARDGDMRLWQYPLDIAADGGAAIVPLPEPTAPTYNPDSLVTPRQRDEKRDEESDDEN